MNKKPESIDDYLTTVDDEKRAALVKLRRSIRAAAPKAEECISYGIPAFRLNGRLLACFHAAKNHCSFFPGAFPIAVCKKEIKNYDTGKGTIRFAADEPLPFALVKKLVKARIAQSAARAEAVGK